MRKDIILEGGRGEGEDGPQILWERTCESGSTPGLTGVAAAGLGAGEAAGWAAAAARPLTEASSDFSFSPEAEMMESFRLGLDGIAFLGFAGAAAAAVAEVGDGGERGVDIVVGSALDEVEVEFLLPGRFDRSVVSKHVHVTSGSERGKGLVVPRSNIDWNLILHSEGAGGLARGVEPRRGREAI